MTLDTNIIIAYLGGEELVVSLVNDLIEDGKLLYLPSAVEIEVLSFSHWKAGEVAEVEQFLSKSFVFVPIDRLVARTTASIRRTHKIKTPDATIAATAILTNTPLITRNVHDFKHISGLSLREI